VWQGKDFGNQEFFKTATRSDSNGSQGTDRPVTSWMLQSCEITICGYFAAIPRAGTNYVGDAWLLGHRGAQKMCNSGYHQ